MNTNFLKRLWLITRIWLVAVMTNAVLGTLYLTDFTYSFHTGTILFAGMLWGVPFSLPVAIIIMVVMNRFIKGEMNELQLFRGILVTGILMSVIMFLTFCWFIKLPGEYRIVLLSNAVLSGIIAMAIQYRPLLKLGKNLRSPSKND
jgi:hypothetical protein